MSDMPRLPPDEVPINLDSVTPTPSGCGSPLIVERLAAIDEWRTPEGFVKRILESTGLPATLHGLASASLTGRTARQEPELQDYRQRDEEDVLDAEQMIAWYSEELFSGSAKHGNMARTWTPNYTRAPSAQVAEPTRVDFRVSAETVLSLSDLAYATEDK